MESTNQLPQDIITSLKVRHPRVIYKPTKILNSEREIRSSMLKKIKYPNQLPIDRIIRKKVPNICSQLQMRIQKRHHKGNWRTMKLRQQSMVNFC